MYDCIIIGGGHNGLVAAAYLGKAGKKVCVLERRHVLGGCATTEELWPGYKISTAAYVISLFLPSIIQELRLKEYGLKILPRTPSSFTPTLDGRSLLMGPDKDLTRREIAKFSQRDAEAYPKYEALLEKTAAVIEPLLMETATDPLPLPATWRKIGIRKRLRDGRALWKLMGALKTLGNDMPEALELLTGPARPILERWFESEPLRATLATDAIIGSFTSIESAGSAYVLLHHVMGEAGGARGVWGYVQGGMGGLATALEGACGDLGVEIRREAPVAKINVAGGKTSGVTLASGEELSARYVASSIDPHWTFERMLQANDLPQEFLKAVKRIDYSSASLKINLALSEPPRFTCLDTPGVGPQHHGTMHISPNMEYLERAYDDAKYGRPSASPVLEMTMPTSVDTSLAPDGKHVLSMFVQYAPYKLKEGNWDDIKEKFADRCLEIVAEYAPNMRNAVIHRQVLSPLDLERVYGLTGGNIFQGAMTLGQLYLLRPVAGWADYRTPVQGLYLCGAAVHPGGGVMGSCGRNAAWEMMRDGL